MSVKYYNLIPKPDVDKIYNLIKREHQESIIKQDMAAIKYYNLIPKCQGKKVLYLITKNDA